MAYGSLNSGSTGTLGTKYSSMCQGILYEASVWDKAISPSNEVVIAGEGNAVTFPSTTGLRMSTRNDSSDSSELASSITSAMATATGVPKEIALSATKFTRSATPWKIIDAYSNDAMMAVGMAVDELASTAAVAGTNITRINSRADDAHIVSGDIATFASISETLAKMKKARASKFVIPGIGPVYIGFVHPFVSHDLFKESSGLITGNQFANQDSWITGSIGVKMGVLWIESNPEDSSSAGILESLNTGSGSTVDVYKTVILGANGLCRVKIKLDIDPEVFTLVVDDEGSVQVEICRDGDLKKMYAYCYQGFSIRSQSDIWQIHSSSSLGTNT